MDLISQETGTSTHHSTPAAPCRISLWSKIIRKGHITTGIKMRLVWGVVEEEGGHPRVIETICTSPSSSDKSRALTLFLFMSVNTSEWCFAPTYIFRDAASSTDSFDCIVFPQMGKATSSEFNSAFKFGFSSQEGKHPHELPRLE